MSKLDTRANRKRRYFMLMLLLYSHTEALEQKLVSKQLQLGVGRNEKRSWSYNISQKIMSLLSEFQKSNLKSFQEKEGLMNASRPSQRGITNKTP